MGASTGCWRPRAARPTCTCSRPAAASRLAPGCSATGCATHAEDRAAYGALKAELATRGFADVMDYNNHKAALVYDLYERMFTADPDARRTTRSRGPEPVRAPDRSGSSPPAPGAARCCHRDRRS